MQQDENPTARFLLGYEGSGPDQETADEIHTLRYQIAREFLQNVVDYKPDADAVIRRLKARG